MKLTITAVGIIWGAWGWVTAWCLQIKEMEVLPLVALVRTEGNKQQGQTIVENANCRFFVQVGMWGRDWMQQAANGGDGLERWRGCQTPPNSLFASTYDQRVSANLRPAWLCPCMPLIGGHQGVGSVCFFIYFRQCWKSGVTKLFLHPRKWMKLVIHGWNFLFILKHVHSSKSSFVVCALHDIHQPSIMYLGCLGMLGMCQKRYHEKKSWMGICRNGNC